MICVRKLKALWLSLQTTDKGTDTVEEAEGQQTDFDKLGVWAKKWPMEYSRKMCNHALC